MKYLFFILAILCFSCVHGWFAEPIGPGEPEELVIDSCIVTPIDTPLIRCITSVYQTDAPLFARIGWRGDYIDWIVGSVELDDPMNILAEVVNNETPYTGVSFIDKSSIVSGVMTLDFIMCFTKPVGIFHEGTGDDIVFEWGDTPQTIIKRLAVRKDIANYIYPPDASTQGELIGFIENHPEYKKLGLFGIQLDSIDLEPVLDASLVSENDTCKGSAIIDLRGHNVSQFYLDQFNYQNFTVIQ